jgi:hypothetical protein
MNVGLGYGNHVRNDEGNDQELAWSIGTPCLFSKKHGYSHDKYVIDECKVVSHNVVSHLGND